MARPDDDALSWDGDDDPTLDVGAAPAAPRSDLPSGYTAVGKGAESVAAAGAASSSGVGAAPVVAPAAGPMGNATLITIGVLGGVYALFTIGWLLGAGRLQLIADLFLDPVAFQVTRWLAVLAAPLWFGTVLLLTREKPAWMRLVLLAAGAVLLVPWPFVLAGAAL
ncbi:DNA polymerase III subunit gamma/tau [Microbacterium terricola]|uniref:DNA polymerase III subunit gamma/tau n=1 Tax=Microbacterium terricola TaxID=344163 RepID=A0ABM8DZH4_9MICO|nr:DNA polymerase III subunit gamma/tau [Microbacterium terricola]UYK41308.1 DNA polymerase III subunit gamma/tau [Microbacterium terricola]BDV30910.1 hypothetical protein Microterr_15700 [Microbacterium terricola]